MVETLNKNMNVYLFVFPIYYYLNNQTGKQSTFQVCGISIELVEMSGKTSLFDGVESGRGKP